MPSGSRTPRGPALPLLVALLVSLAISSVVAYSSFSSSPAYSSPKRLALSAEDFSVSPPFLSPDYGSGVLSFVANSALNATLSTPRALPEANSTSREEVNFSVYWGYLFRWSISISPGYVNGSAAAGNAGGSRLWISVVPSEAVPSQEGEVVIGLVGPGGVPKEDVRVLANASGSLPVLSFAYARGRLVVAEGNRTLASFPASSFSPSPLLLVEAEKGAPVLLTLNYVSFWDEASLWAQRVGAAERAFALSFPFSFVPLAVAAVEWRRALKGMRWIVRALGANLAAPFAVAAVGLLLAAAVAYSLINFSLADSLSVYAYLALVAAVVAAAIDERRKGKRSGEEGDEEREGRKRRELRPERVGVRPRGLRRGARDQPSRLAGSAFGRDERPFASRRGRR